MEFTKQPPKRQTTGTKPPRYGAGATSRPPSSSVPTVREAVKTSVKTIRLAFSHATKAVVREGKVLFRLTEEEFGLEENARWQKVRSLPRKVSRKLKLPKWPRKVYVIIGCTLLILLMGSFVYNRFIHKPTHQTPPKSYTSSKLEKGTPKYDTLLPAGKTIDNLGGWTRVSPGTASPVYAFSDRVDGIGVIVSEQPLPDALTKPGALEEFTKAYSADHKVSVEGTDIYIGTSAKGPQSAILTKSNLLILIKTDSKLTDAQWATYVGSLS